VIFIDCVAKTTFVLISLGWYAYMKLTNYLEYQGSIASNNIKTCFEPVGLNDPFFLVVSMLNCLLRY
jgi:hypothetical protein